MLDSPSCRAACPQHRRDAEYIEAAARGPSRAAIEHLPAASIASHHQNCNNATARGGGHMREPLPPRYAAAIEPATNGRVNAAAPGAEPAPRVATPSRFQTFSSLRYRDFRFLWVGTLFMSAGQLVQQV